MTLSDSWYTYHIKNVITRSEILIKYTYMGLEHGLGAERTDIYIHKYREVMHDIWCAYDVRYVITYAI